MTQTIRNTKATIRPCPVCGRQRERHTKEFCSISCAHASRWLKRKQEIARTGIAPSNDRAAKRYLVETYGHSCSRCHITEWFGEPLVLILDHVNGNAFDYVLTNLRLLCSNCDSQMPTWKNRNHGKGRGARKRQLDESPGAAFPDAVCSSLGKEEILACLTSEGWNISRAAERVGLHRNVVYRLMREHGIKRKDTVEMEGVCRAVGSGP
jgi:endogenous inhibitor of DNA gyrase (YacG/DUF329 family)